MTQLQKAQLGELDRRGRVTQEIPVQFNPTSLRLQMTNSIDPGRTRGRQVQQYNGTSSTNLSVDLEFDTADEDQGGGAVDVRTLTQEVVKFVLPGGTGSRQAPPRVQFRWGRFVLAGVMASVSEELDLFSAEGVPLRAKLSVQIKEQDPKFEALERGAGANPATAAPVSGQPSPPGPGTTGLPAAASDRLAEALDGESAADFLARQGLDPSAWRAITDGVGDVLNLLPGEPIGFNLNLPLGGLGISFGGELELGIGMSVEASLGLEASATVGTTTSTSTSVNDPDPSGFALAAAGGLTAAAEIAALTTTTEAADATRASFTTGSTSAARARSAPSAPNAASPQSRTRLRDQAGARTLPSDSRATGAPVTGAPVTGAPATSSAPPEADARATSYGNGIPLRDRITPEEIRLARSPWIALARRQPTDIDSADSHRQGAQSCSCGCRR